jgi:hypothetical protein
VSRSLYEPNTIRDVAKGKQGVKSLQQKPAAMRWWQLECTPGDSGCTGDEPFFINGFAQPTGVLELFAFRLNADGLIQTEGFIDTTGATSGTVAWVMPGVNPGETDFIPPTSANEGFPVKVTTDGAATGITSGQAYIDAVTGDVTVTWGFTSSIPFFRAYKWNGATQTINNTNDGYIYWDRYQTSDSAKINIDSWQAGSPDVFNRINLKARGLYSISCSFDLDPVGTFTGDFGIALEGATSEFYPAPMTTWKCTERAGDSSSGQWAWTFLMSFPPIWREQTVDVTSPIPKNLRIAFSNNAGSNVDVTEFMIEIHLLYQFDYETAEGTIQSQA